MFTLRPYQQAACDAAMDWLRTSIDPCLIDAAPAAGKSYMIAYIAKALHAISGKRVLCLAPSAELVTQNHEKYLMTGEKASIFSSSAGAKSTRHVVVFGTPGTVKNAMTRFTQDGPSGFCAVVVDECFPAGTMIDTPHGPKPIDSLKTGDIVCNSVGSGQVETVFTKAVTEIYHVKLSDGTAIQCTGNHPFFTEDGWVKASDLEGKSVFTKEDVSRLLDGFRPDMGADEEAGRDASSHKKSGFGSALEQASNLFTVLREEMEEPHARRFFAGEDEGNVEAHRAQAASNMGERLRPDSAAAISTGSSGGAVGRGTSDSNRHGPQERGLPERIQGGFGKPGNDGCHRGGWGQSRNFGATSGRQEEGCAFGSIRVESVSRVQLESPQVVFNLHISGHPSYYAGGVLVHNCHGITPTIQAIIETMRAANPNLRVLGLSGTPYRLGSGYIYHIWPDGKINDDTKARNPYFMKCVYRVSAREMLDEEFITPMTIGAINAESYDTGNIRVLANGQANTEDIERAFEGHGRETAAVVADVIEQARLRPGGVMYFAATVRHAHEILASLPPGISAMVTGDTPRDERRAIIKAYRSRDIRHLVSVGTLTTGFDVPHTETIALLRFTESASLLQQILGRAWRLHPGKEDSLLLDYAGNVERHFPDGDIYSPVIKASGGEGGEGCLEALCPDCGHVNEFTPHKDYLAFQKDQHGYCLDVFGEQVLSEFGPVPGHYGRRCFGLVQTGKKGEHERCGYYWTSKACPACEEPNDIAARYCRSCKAEIINPNEKLVSDFKAMKRDPTRLQTDKVLSMAIKEGVSSRGNRTVRADFVTPYRQFPVWFAPDVDVQAARRKYARFAEATEDDRVPLTITYRKDPDSGFFEIVAYDQPEDQEPDVPQWGNLTMRGMKHTPPATPPETQEAA